jgi:transposase-like protein
MRIVRPSGTPKRARRTFSAEQKQEAVRAYESAPKKTLIAAARELDIDVSVFRKWISAFGTGVKLHGARVRREPTPLKRVELGPDPDRPHLQRIERFLLTKPRHLHAIDRVELREAVSEAVAKALGEEAADGEALIAELANQGHRISEAWPTPEFPAPRYRLNLFDPPKATAFAPYGSRSRLLNPWGHTL